MCDFRLIPLVFLLFFNFLLKPVCTCFAKSNFVCLDVCQCVCVCLFWDVEIDLLLLWLKTKSWKLLLCELNFDWKTSHLSRRVYGTSNAYVFVSVVLESSKIAWSTAYSCQCCQSWKRKSVLFFSVKYCFVRMLSIVILCFFLVKMLPWFCSVACLCVTYKGGNPLISLISFKIRSDTNYKINKNYQQDLYTLYILENLF